MSEAPADACLNKPLGGRRILVTRAARQAAALAEPLQTLGAEVFVCPTIEIVPAEDSTDLDEALTALDQVDILIISSPNAVDFFFARLGELDVDPTSLAGKTIVAVGPKTAAAIRRHGLQVDLIPKDYRAEGLVDMLRGQVAGRCILYPKAGLARDLIPSQLAEAGARVLAPVAYTSIVPADSAAKLTAAIRRGLDLLTFTASSTVHHMVELLDDGLLEKARQVPVASIGPLTSQTARRLGFQVVIEPSDSTLDDLIAAIRQYYQENTPSP